MKKTVIAIFVLFSFLVLIGHDMIPHHHHDNVSNPAEKHTQHHNHKNDHHDHGGKGDDHENKDSSNHEHSFPIHAHFYQSHDLNYLRVYSSNKVSFNYGGIVILVSDTNSGDSFKPPESKINRTANLPDKIRHYFVPGAAAWRAPPSIA